MVSQGNNIEGIYTGVGGNTEGINSTQGNIEGTSQQNSSVTPNMEVGVNYSQNYMGGGNLENNSQNQVGGGDLTPNNAHYTTTSEGDKRHSINIGNIQNFYTSNIPVKSENR